jgi:pimeloyl-ACP methyl ester carboxylesterase
MSTFSDRVKRWEERGHKENFRGHEIHCSCHAKKNKGSHESDNEPLVLILHGYPTCSFDWKDVIDVMIAPSSMDILTFDMLGFGLSDKPNEHVYSLEWQADLALELVIRHTQQNENKGQGQQQRNVYLIGIII